MARVNVQQNMIQQNMTSLKIKPKQIAFDIDGVVSDTMSSFLRIARDEFGVDGIRQEQITSYWLEDCLPMDEEIIKAVIERILSDPFGTGLRPMDGAGQVLEQIAHHAPLRFITARPVGLPIETWLRDMLDPVPAERIHVIATGKHEIKVEILKELGVRYFVEDHLETCRAICEAGLKAIIYDHPWNQGETPFLRVRNWRELERIMDL